MLTNLQRATRQLAVAASPRLMPLALRALSSHDNGSGGDRSHSHDCCSGHDSANDKDLSDIFAQNEKWRADMLKEDPYFFDKLGAGHNPRRVGLQVRVTEHSNLSSLS